MRIPNMEGPCASSTFYVTLSHEYGFAASNLMSLLDICGFDDLRLMNFSAYKPDLKQRLGELLRWPILQQSRLLNRLIACLARTAVASSARSQRGGQAWGMASLFRPPFQTGRSRAPDPCMALSGGIGSTVN